MNMEDMPERRLQAHERIIEILVYILAEMRKHQQLADIDLGQLSQRGFSQTEISTAFSWLFDKMSPSPDLSAGVEFRPSNKYVPADGSIRIYHDVERSVLTTDAQGYLMQLRELAIISSAEMEAVIDRIMMMGISPIGIAEVKELVAGLLFDSEDTSRGLGRMMLNPTDTIQ
jgi:uncharacterized protein Smg (DUF494 family)